ncbi:MAG: sporulation integral membrane protein YtvI [Lachnospiraceae bacterium]|nr:sporulation integral membrane protein YtvI [Lachnospiraceae bacterium]
MKETIKHYVKILLNIAVTVCVLLLVIFVLPRLLLFLLPFLIGWLIASVAYPIVSFTEKRIKIRRRAMSVVVIALAVAGVAMLLYGIGYVLIQEIIGFSDSVPQMIASVKETIDKASAFMGHLFVRAPFIQSVDIDQIYDGIIASIGDWITKLGKPLMSIVGNTAKNIPSIIIGVIVCLLSAYFFIAEKEGVTNVVTRHTPMFIRDKWMVIYNSIFGAIGGYIKAQFKIECIMYILLLVGLAFLKVRYAALIALGIAFLDLLPVFGTGTVLVPWVLVKVLEGDYRMAIGLFILWGAGQLFRQLIQPKIVGDSIGLAPLPTLFLIYIGWQFGGVIGMLVAVPIGVLIINLNEAGLFDNIKESFRILLKDLGALRTYTEKDRQYYKHYLEEDDEKL